MTWRDTLEEARPLLRLGLATMSAALMVAAIAYVVRVVIVRYLGFEAAGIYQSATALSSVYCGFILSAMGADFLPRVSSVPGDDAQCNRLVNEQAEVGLLLAFPGICATLAFAPCSFSCCIPDSSASPPKCCGGRCSVSSCGWHPGRWVTCSSPKGRPDSISGRKLSQPFYAALIWICVQLWGLPGTGIAFFGLYVYYFLLMSVVTHKLSGFAWSAPNKRFALVAIPTVAFVFVCPMILPSPWHFIAAGATTTLVGLYSLRTLVSLAGRQGIQGSLADQILDASCGWLEGDRVAKVKHG